MDMAELIIYWLFPLYIILIIAILYRRNQLIKSFSFNIQLPCAEAGCKAIFNVNIQIRHSHNLLAQSDLKEKKWQVEKSALEASISKLDRRYNELNEKNKVLDWQLDALHIKIAETEISLLKQEKLWLQSQSDLEKKWQVEKSALEAAICKLDRSYDELNEQNKVLESQLEALRIKVVETEISLLKQEKLRLESQVCPICLTYNNDTAFSCGHLTCKECSPRLSHCPICRQSITIRIRIYT